MRNKDQTNKRVIEREIWRDLESNPIFSAETSSKKNAIQVDMSINVSGYYGKASTTISYESARSLAQWILTVTEK